MIVLAIDPGYRNFATAVVSSFNPRHPTHWRNEDIFPRSGRASEEDIFRITVVWCRRHRSLLENVTLIVIERQMQARFKIMTTVIRSMYPEKTVLVTPNQVTAHFGLTNLRAQKKEEAVCWCRVLFDRAVPGADKQDDLADAALMALMALELEMKAPEFYCYSIIVISAPEPAATSHAGTAVASASSDVRLQGRQTFFFSSQKAAGLARYSAE